MFEVISAEQKIQQQFMIHILLDQNLFWLFAGADASY